MLKNVALEKTYIRVLAGSMQDAVMQKAFSTLRAPFEILRNVRDMPSLLLDTDLCISAAGSTCWELCCLGVPFLTLTVAENQEHAAKRLSDAGIAPSLTLDSLKFFMNDPQARAQSSSEGMALVDGWGTQKILSCFTGNYT